jgi:hypothetical protein
MRERRVPRRTIEIQQFIERVRHVLSGSFTE